MAMEFRSRPTGDGARDDKTLAELAAMAGELQPTGKAVTAVDRHILALIDVRVRGAATKGESDRLLRAPVTPRLRRRA